MLSKKQKEALIKQGYHKAMSGDTNLLKFFLDRINEKKKIKAENTSSILKLLADGKITPHETQTLMNTLKSKTEIEEIPKLMKQLEALSKKQR